MVSYPFLSFPNMKVEFIIHSFTNFNLSKQILFVIAIIVVNKQSKRIPATPLNGMVNFIVFKCEMDKKITTNINNSQFFWYLNYFAKCSSFFEYLPSLHNIWKLAYFFNLKNFY